MQVSSRVCPEEFLNRAKIFGNSLATIVTNPALTGDEKKAAVKFQFVKAHMKIELTVKCAFRFHFKLLRILSSTGNLSRTEMPTKTVQVLNFSFNIMSTTLHGDK